jgi:hypothetical protein
MIIGDFERAEEAFETVVEHRDEVALTGDLAATLHLDDELEDMGMPGGDRITCAPCKSWADHWHNLFSDERLEDPDEVGRHPLTGEPLSPADAVVIPVPDVSTCVFGAVRCLSGVRVAGQFVVYDSQCVDIPHSSDMCMAIAPDEGTAVQAMDTALVTGTPYGRQILRATVECGGATLTEITTSGSPDELAALRTALTYFNDSSTDPKERAVFRALYQHLTQKEIR